MFCEKNFGKRAERKGACAGIRTKKRETEGM